MSTVPTFLLLALLVEPTVAIGVGRDAGGGREHPEREAQLAALLTWRMLDDGLRVVGDLEAAQITLRVQLHADHSAAIVVSGASERVEHLGPGPAGTFELELLQVEDLDGTTLVSVARAGHSCRDPESSFGRFALGEGALTSAVDAAALALATSPVTASRCAAPAR